MKSKKKRTLKHICLLLCLCSVGLFVIGFLHQPSVTSITLTDNVHAGLWNQEFDTRLVFCYGDEYDPSKLATHFPGSITQKTFYFSTVPGIYYRYIRTDLDTHWVFLLGLWYPFGIFAILAIYFQLKENFYRNLPGKTDGGKDEKEGPRQK